MKVYVLTKTTSSRPKQFIDVFSSYKDAEKAIHDYMKLKTKKSNPDISNEDMNHTFFTIHEKEI